MGQALQMAQARLGKKPESQGEVEDPQKKAITELEAAINKIEDIEARDLLRAKVKAMTMEYERQAREAAAKNREDSGGGRKEVGEDEGMSLADQVVLLKQNGASDEVIRNYIVATKSGNQSYNIGVGGGQPLTIEGIISIIKEFRGAGPTTDPAVTALLQRLVDKDEEEKEARIQAIKEQNAAFIKRFDTGQSGGGAGQGIKIYSPDGELINTIEPGGIIIRPGATEKKSVEELHEENRHAEEQERNANEKAYKDKVANHLGEAVGAMTEFAATEAEKRAKQHKDKNGKPEIEEMTCQNEKCGKPIIVPPGAHKFSCPHCGQEYSDQD